MKKSTAMKGSKYTHVLKTSAHTTPAAIMQNTATMKPMYWNNTVNLQLTNIHNITLQLQQDSLS